MARKLLGKYIVADSEICHGKPTFIGTRILVGDVLEQVAMGRDWEGISKAWGGKVSQEAISEALNLAKQVFIEHVQDYAQPASA